MKKFENIVIATDLDGTYFGSKTRLVPRNLEMVKYFCENGGHFTFNTGRLPIFMRKSVPNADELINMPAITGNGTCLYDFHKNAPIKEHFHNSEMLSDFLGFVRAYSSEAGMRGCIPTGFVIPNLENKYTTNEYYYFPDFMEKRIMPIEEWGSLDVYKVNIMDTHERLAELYEIMKERYAGKLHISRASMNSIEIMPSGTSKAIMLRETVDELFDRPMMLCTVGDYDNDLEMHKIADLPVCPANANDRVKAVCKECFCSNEDGVIADLIEFLDK